MENGKNGDAFNEQKIRRLVEDAAEKGRELLNEGLESAKEMLQEQTAAIRKKAEQYGLDEAADGVKSYVQKNPLQSIGVALALGLVLGRLLSPSSSEETHR